MSVYELARLNIGIIKGPMDSPVMADFAANLGREGSMRDGRLAHSHRALGRDDIGRGLGVFSVFARGSGAQGFEIRGDGAHLILRKVLDHFAHDRRVAQIALNS